MAFHERREDDLEGHVPRSREFELLACGCEVRIGDEVGSQEHGGRVRLGSRGHLAADLALARTFV
jgi:hypothetical protein